MKTDAVKVVGVDEKGRLYVEPETETFPYIYREAMEVHWNPDRRILYGAPPREYLSLTYPQWFSQIVSAAKEQGCKLTLGEGTKWVNITAELKNEILASCKSA